MGHLGYIMSSRTMWVMKQDSVSEQVQINKNLTQPKISQVIWKQVGKKPVGRLEPFAPFPTATADRGIRGNPGGH